MRMNQGFSLNNNNNTKSPSTISAVSKAHIAVASPADSSSPSTPNHTVTPSVTIKSSSSSSSTTCTTPTDTGNKTTGKTHTSGRISTAQNQECTNATNSISSLYEDNTEAPVTDRVDRIGGGVDGGVTELGTIGVVTVGTVQKNSLKTSKRTSAFEKQKGKVVLLHL